MGNTGRGSDCGNKRARIRDCIGDPNSKSRPVRGTRYSVRGTKAMTFGTIEQAIDDLRNGKLIIVADDEDRENEGDLICAAELVTPEMVNFMITHARGWVCLALSHER